MSRDITAIKAEALEMMNDPRTGLRDSSDTNKTRYGLLGLIEEAYKVGLTHPHA